MSRFSVSRWKGGQRTAVRIIGGRVALPACLDVFGVLFYTDLLRRDLKRPDIEPWTPWEANIWVF